MRATVKISLTRLETLQAAVMWVNHRAGVSGPGVGLGPADVTVMKVKRKAGRTEEVGGIDLVIDEKEESI